MQSLRIVVFWLPSQPCLFFVNSRRSPLPYLLFRLRDKRFLYIPFWTKKTLILSKHYSDMKFRMLCIFYLIKADNILQFSFHIFNFFFHDIENMFGSSQ